MDFQLQKAGNDNYFLLPGNDTLWISSWKTSTGAFQTGREKLNYKDAGEAVKSWSNPEGIHWKWGSTRSSSSFLMQPLPHINILGSKFNSWLIFSWILGPAPHHSQGLEHLGWIPKSWSSQERWNCRDGAFFREVYLQKMGKVREKIKEKENNLIYHQPEPHLDILKIFPRGVLKFWKEKCSLKTGVDKSSLPFWISKQITFKIPSADLGTGCPKKLQLPHSWKCPRSGSQIPHSGSQSQTCKVNFP